MQRSVPAGLLRQIRRTIARYEMLQGGDRVLVALSGGPDSVALLAALVELAGGSDVAVCAAHLNHHLRGEESRRDQQAAELVARQLGVPCVIGDCAALGGAANLEARARAARYEFLAQVAAAHDCTKIATGHTLDDQAETVLMRLLRGAGVDGLRGIQPVRGERIIRPMIECSRAQVLSFLQARRLPFCEDSSNQDRRFVRNRIRHDVLPLLETINPAARKALASIAGRLAGEGELLEAHAMAIVARGRAADGALAVSALAQAPAGLRGRVARCWLRAQRGDLRRLTASHLQATVELALGARPNASVRLPGGQQVVREYDHLRYVIPAAAAAQREQPLVPGGAVCLASGWRLSAEILQDGWDRPRDLWELVADADAVSTPLLVRTPRSGDRIRPLGLGGQRKLQDIFVDRKVPVRLRRGCPLVESAGQILWVPGVVRSEHALIHPATRAVLRVRTHNSAIAGT